MFPLIGLGGAPRARYQIARSLRFNDDDTAYLTRTFSTPTNGNRWTFSAWVKPTNLSTSTPTTIFSAGSGSNDFSGIEIGNGTDSFIRVFRVGPGGGTTLWFTNTTAVLRDTASWYHLHVIWDGANGTSADRMIVTLNGVRLTNSSTPPTSADSFFNANSNVHAIGRSQSGTGRYFDGYMADVHFVDGSAVPASTFGETDANTGAWIPRRVTGVTYGNNGFWLSFANNASTTTLGQDDAGGEAGSGAGSKDWTLNNFSVTAGSANDSLTDTPTNNHCTLTILDRGTTNLVLSNGGLDYVKSGANFGPGRGTIGVKSGKWYFEMTAGSGGIKQVGVSNDYDITQSSGDNSVASTGGIGAMWDSRGYLYRTGTSSASGGYSAPGGNTFTNNDVVMVAFDADTGQIWFGKNGTWNDSGNPAAGTGAAFTASGYQTLTPIANGETSGAGSLNFGQRAFAYTPPSGFSSLCTNNLPTPTIRRSRQRHNAVLYTGTGSSQGVTGMGHQPDLVLLKSRSAATDWALYDSIRGAQSRLETNNTDAVATSDAGLTAFGADGFTVNTLAQVNTNTATYVGYGWDEEVAAGLDILQYTGDNTANRNISHGLGAAPHFAIVKRQDSTGNWFVYHRSLSSAAHFLGLNTTDAQSNTNSPWGTGNWSASQFMVSNAGNNANAAAATYMAYLWTEIAGFSRFGSYVGNSSANGPFVWCGFRPRLVLFKKISAGGDNWRVKDSARAPFNDAQVALSVSTGGAEFSGSTESFDILSNGFKIRTSDGSSNSGTFIFAAFAEIPFKYANAR